MLTLSRSLLLLCCLSSFSGLGFAAELLVSADAAGRATAAPVPLRAFIERSRFETFRSAGLQSVSEAVVAARDGHFDQAFSYLFVHLDRFHRDTKVHAETLVVMEWAQRYEEAVVSALSRPDLQLPLYAVKSVVRSARRAGLHVDAEDFLQVGFAIAPDDPDLLSARIHLLGDQGQLDEGLRLANQAVQKYPLHADLWLAKYYLHLLRKDNVAALDAVERAVALAPSDYARRELIYSLERSGMPQRALELLQADPALVSADETFRLRLLMPPRSAGAARFRHSSKITMPKLIRHCPTLMPCSKN